MDKASLATLAVAVIAALSAWASQRAASRASTTNTNTTSRVEMEKEAYDRARAYDTETISRQDAEIAELRSEHNNCAEEIKTLKLQMQAKDEEINTLRNRIARLEQGLSNNLEELLRERLREPDTGYNDPTFQ